MQKSRILIVDDNPAIHKDFEKILHFRTEFDQNARYNELSRELFEDASIAPNAPLDKTDVGAKTPDLTADTVFSLPRYELSFAHQGQEALQIVKDNLERPYAVIFVDMRMPPGWDGIETIFNIWKVDPNIQMVVCTAYSDYSWEQMIEKLGNTHNVLILKKPFDVIEVRQLAFSLSKKWHLNHELQSRLTTLEGQVSERTKALENTLALVRSTLESTADGVLVVDLEHRVIDYNKKFLDLWKISESALFSQEKSPLIYNILENVKNPNDFISQINILKTNIDSESFNEILLNNNCVLECYSLPHRVRGKVVGRVWNFRDISVKKNMEAKLLHNASHDTLTDLPNRKSLAEHIQALINDRQGNAVNRSFAVMFLDLDRFKLINDSFGHHIGDYLLRAVVRRLQETLREDDFISRFGGDEFILVINDTEHTRLSNLVSRILNLIQKPFQIDMHQFSVTASIGIAIYPKDGASSEDLIKNSDTAMYQAKDNGRNNFQLYDYASNLNLVEKLLLENDLRRAVEDRGQLQIFYQPILDSKTHQIVAAEALLRWFHPALGIILPDDFVPMAEETGLILPIGAWLLETACAQNKAWQDKGLPKISLAVNCSNKQFKQQKVDEVIETTLVKTGLAPQYLELEITETAIMEHLESSIAMLTRINALGVRLVIDDFGVGYSSLSHLKRYPFSKLKIDKGFLKDLDDNPENAAIVEAILALAGGLKLHVCAEGIEKQSQLDFLNLDPRNVCHEVQGYFFSKPLTVKEFEILLQANKPL